MAQEPVSSRALTGPLLLAGGKDSARHAGALKQQGVEVTADYMRRK
jgi:tRNA U34 2-thiouridine synthase MnmA/TrmU